MLDRTTEQAAVYDFVTEWHKGLKLDFDGVEIGACLEYQITQLLNIRVLQQLEKEATKDD